MGRLIKLADVFFDAAPWLLPGPIMAVIRPVAAATALRYDLIKMVDDLLLWLVCYWPQQCRPGHHP